MSAWVVAAIIASTVICLAWGDIQRLAADRRGHRSWWQDHS